MKTEERLIMDNGIAETAGKIRETIPRAGAGERAGPQPPGQSGFGQRHASAALLSLSCIS